MKNQERKVRIIPKLNDGSKVTFTVQLEGEMDWNLYFAGKHFAGDGGLFDPYNKLEKKSFREALQAFLAQAFLERGLLDSNDEYKTYRITNISYPSEIDGIYDNARNDSVEKEKLEAIEELKRLEFEEKRLQERKNILKAKAKL